MAAIGNLTKWRRVRRKNVEEPLRILIIRRDGLGDFVLTTPLLRELRRNFSSAKITLLTGDNVKELATKCPYVDSAETIDPRVLRVSKLVDLIKFVETKFYGKFDLALLPRWDVDLYWSTLIACLSGAPRIVAYTRKTSRLKSRMNWGYDGLLTDVLPRGELVHELDRTLALVRYLGGTPKSHAMELWSIPADIAEADSYLETVGVKSRSRPWIAVGIGASQRRRQWPYFADLLALISQRMSFTPFVFVAPDEMDSASELKDAAPECVIVCQPLRVATVIMSRCNLFVGNDSGPLHMAAASGLPTVEISCHPQTGDRTSEHSPDRFGRTGENARVVQPVDGLDNCSASCAEDFPHCISLVTPEQVIAAIESVVAIPASMPIKSSCWVH
ncbi:MAG: glycosyltransferase family 9 protein [Acidobacteriota bacterium]|nr:glycosyltransferase family 9 protein [Acidobacteriota bacterium]